MKKKQLHCCKTTKQKRKENHVYQYLAIIVCTALIHYNKVCKLNEDFLVSLFLIVLTALYSRLPPIISLSVPSTV